MRTLALIFILLSLTSCNDKVGEFWKGFRSTFFSPGWEEKAEENGVIFDKNPYDGIYYSKFMFMDVIIMIEGEQITHISSNSAETIVDCKQYHNKVVYTDVKGAKRVLRPKGDSSLYMFVMGKEMVYYKQDRGKLANGGDFYFPRKKELAIEPVDFLPEPMKKGVVESKKRSDSYNSYSYNKRTGLYGNPGRGGGSSLDMAGWMWDFKPEPEDTSSETGRLVFEIKVNEEGEILSVRRLESTVSSTVEKIYRQEVEQLTFSKTSDNALVAPISTGRITFVIRSR